MPEQIEVDRSIGAEHHTQDDQTIPNETYFYRDNSNIPDAVKVLAENLTPGSDTRILNCASSIGAEPYSAISTMEHNGIGGRIAIMGLDPEQRNLGAMMRGRYHTVPDPFFSIESIASDEKLAKILRSMGLEASHEADQLTDFTSPDREAYYTSRIIIGTDGLRQRHEVLPIEGVMLDAPALLPGIKFEWVLANNIFYHMTPEEAMQSLVAVAGMVAEGGVFSMSSRNRRYMNTDQSRILTFRSWHNQAYEVLESLGFRSARHSGYDVDNRPGQSPTVFVRI